MKYEIEEKQAKETADRNHTKAGDLDCWEFIGDEFKAFCEQLCKEQRKICAKIYHNSVYTAIDVESKIFNAKQPEL